VKLHREERQYLHLPFWGLSGATPQVQVGEGEDWEDMTSVPSYEPPSEWAPPTGYVAGDADWYRALIAGPDATSNPVGTIVLSTVTTRVRTRVTAGDEVDVQPDGPDDWIHLIP
jgi:hypothetical protein